MRVRTYDASGVSLPGFLEHVAGGVDELAAVVVGRIVRGGDHAADVLGVEHERAQSGQQAHAVQDPVEVGGARPEAGRAVRHMLGGKGGWLGEWCVVEVARLDVLNN